MLNLPIGASNNIYRMVNNYLNNSFTYVFAFFIYLIPNIIYFPYEKYSLSILILIKIFLIINIIISIIMLRFIYFKKTKNIKNTLYIFLIIVNMIINIILFFNSFYIKKNDNNYKLNNNIKYLLYINLCIFLFSSILTLFVFHINLLKVFIAAFILYFI